ncbi:hypothetical protein B0H11DRAFT_1910713 [Mycena galericulata]|nr:hypothetical protein B0H11DRAFT_1910713 [Mycena galericulata]
MFSKTQIGLFALSVLSLCELGVAHPVQSDMSRPNRVVVRVTARAAATSACSVCATAVTVTVSGTATFTAEPGAITVSFGSDSGAPTAGSSENGTSSIASSTTIGAAASPTASSGSSIGNFGSCSSPEIEFGPGFDGQKATTFQPQNRSQRINPALEFICGTLASSCGADATAQSTCTQAQQAADAAISQQGIDADIFNNFFGIVTNFAAIPALDGNVPRRSQPALPPWPLPLPQKLSLRRQLLQELATITRPSTSDNLQLFTGNLGGIAAPAVVASGSEFQVDGNSIFTTKAQGPRSLLVTWSPFWVYKRQFANRTLQHNDCANAANASGNKGDFTVTACNTQQNACNAASGT